MPIRAHSRASVPSLSPFDGVEIRDGNLVLRTLDSCRDVSALFTIIDADRERLGRFLPWVEETRTEGDTLRFIDDAADERRRRRSLVFHDASLTPYAAREPAVRHVCASTSPPH